MISRKGQLHNFEINFDPFCPNFFDKYQCQIYKSFDYSWFYNSKQNPENVITRFLEKKSFIFRRIFALYWPNFREVEFSSKFEVCLLFPITTFQYCFKLINGFWENLNNYIFKLAYTGFFLWFTTTIIFLRAPNQAIKSKNQIWCSI